MMKTYTLDDIMEKKLYILYPFYQFNLEEVFKEYGKSPEDSAKVIGIINEMLDKLENSHLKSYDTHALIEITMKIFSMLARNNAELKEEGEKIMGGRVMKLRIDEVVDKSKAEGNAEGREAEKKDNVISMIKEGLGLEMIARISKLTVEQVTAIGKQAALL